LIHCIIRVGTHKYFVVREVLDDVVDKCREQQRLASPWRPTHDRDPFRDDVLNQLPLCFIESVHSRDVIVLLKVLGELLIRVDFGEDDSFEDFLGALIILVFLNRI